MATAILAVLLGYMVLGKELDASPAAAILARLEVHWDSWPLVTGVALGLALLPYHLMPNLWFWCRRLRPRALLHFSRSVLIVVPSLAMGGGIIVGAIAMLVALGAETIVATLLGIAMGVGFITGIVRSTLLGIRTLQCYLDDRRVLVGLVSRKRETRPEIEDTLRTLKTRFGRWRYLTHLEKLETSPRGAWTSGRLPDFGVEEIETALARMEERWRGLQR